MNENFRKSGEKWSRRDLHPHSFLHLPLQSFIKLNQKSNNQIKTNICQMCNAHTAFECLLQAEILPVYCPIDELASFATVFCNCCIANISTVSYLLMKLMSALVSVFSSVEVSTQLVPVHPIACWPYISFTSPPPGARNHQTTY